MAYYFFLSLPPAVMALFGLTGLFGGQRTGDWLTGRLTGSLPAEASALVTGFVRDVVHGDAPGPLSIGLLLALWAGSNVFTALEGTLNPAFGITAERPFVRKKAVAVGMLAACAVLFLAGSAVLLAGGGISDALGLGAFGRTVWGVLQWPLGFALITATFWLIYYVLPNKDQRGCRMTLLKASAVVRRAVRPRVGGVPAVHVQLRILQRHVRAAGVRHRAAAVDVRDLAGHPAGRRGGVGDGALGVEVYAVVWGFT